MKRVLEETQFCTTPVLKIHKIHKDAVLPSKTHVSDAGLDVTIIGVHKVISKYVKLYSTGIKLEPQEGYHLELIERSSLMKRDYCLSSSVGIIDEMYRGEWFDALRKFDPDAPDTGTER